MTTLEIILSTITGILSGGNIAQFLSLKANKKKLNAEASEVADKVLYDRIDFLDERLTKLEEKACFRTTCENRI